MTNENNIKKKRKSASSTRSSTKLKIPPAFVPDKWICNHSLSRKRKYHQDLHLDKLKYIWPVYKSTSTHTNEKDDVSRNNLYVSSINNAQLKTNKDVPTSRMRNVTIQSPNKININKAVSEFKTERLSKENSIAECENEKPIFFLKNYSSPLLIENQPEKITLNKTQQNEDTKRNEGKSFGRAKKLMKDLKFGNLMRQRFRKRFNAVGKNEKMNLIQEHSPTFSLSSHVSTSSLGNSKQNSSSFRFIRKLLSKTKVISNKTRRDKLFKRRVSLKANKPLYEKLKRKASVKTNKISIHLSDEVKSSEKINSLQNEVPDRQLKVHCQNSSILNDSTLIGSAFFNQSKLTQTTASLNVSMNNEPSNRSVCSISNESTSSISACSLKLAALNPLKSRSEIVQKTKCFFSCLLKSLSVPFIGINHKEKEDEKSLNGIQANGNASISRTNQDIKEEEEEKELGNGNLTFQSFHSNKLTPNLTSTPNVLNPFIKQTSEYSNKKAVQSEKHISHLNKLNAQVRSKSDSDFFRKQMSEKCSQVFSVHDECLRGGNELSEHWIDSGKSKLGIQIERLLRRYYKLSKQKKYLVIVILILIFLSLVLLLVLICLLIQFFIRSMNQTHISPAPTKTSRTPGLVGDMCVKVIGDCGKFMECRMNENNLAWNISTCQCLDGYLADRTRNCRGLLNSQCQANVDCINNSICSSTEKKCVCKDGYHPKWDRTCFGKFNSTCENDNDCLRNGQCVEIVEKNQYYGSIVKRKVCRCSNKQRTIYRPSNEPYQQCKLLVGAKCEGNDDCVENARCKKYCSCKETDLFFETKDFLCYDACKNKTENSLTNQRYQHPTKCGYFYSCSPRDLDICPSNYSFDVNTQACNSTVLCRK